MKNFNIIVISSVPLLHPFLFCLFFLCSGPDSHMTDNWLLSSPSISFCRGFIADFLGYCFCHTLSLPGHLAAALLDLSYQIETSWTSPASHIFPISLIDLLL